MTREQLEHVIRAAASITNEHSFVVIGSQAVLLPYPDAHPDLRVSRELDLYPAMAPEKSDLIEGAIGALSQFDETFGYYADGVSPDTAAMPADWIEQRIRQLEPTQPIEPIVAWARRRAQEAQA